jgi:hypothetical protein
VLGEQEQENHVKICQHLQQRPEKDPEFPFQIITSDEKWFYGYNPEIKRVMSVEEPIISMPPPPKKKGKFAPM